MEQKIKSITEAFSMQPNTWTVGNSYWIHEFNHVISDIKLERIGPDEFYDNLYIAYDSDGNKLFEWQPKAVNITYYPKNFQDHNLNT
jgi:hypothetical protein